MSAALRWRACRLQACKGAYARSAQRLLQWPDLRRGAYDSGPWLLRRAAEEGLLMPVHPGGEPIADQLARQLSLPEVRLQPELLAEAERRLERERRARRETLRALLETAERTEGDFAVCGYDPMQLRAQDGLLWSGSFLALRQADGHGAPSVRSVRCAACGRSPPGDGAVCAANVTKLSPASHWPVTGAW